MTDNKEILKEILKAITNPGLVELRPSEHIKIRRKVTRFTLSDDPEDENCTEVTQWWIFVKEGEDWLGVLNLDSSFPFDNPQDVIDRLGELFYPQKV